MSEVTPQLSLEMKKKKEVTWLFRYPIKFHAFIRLKNLKEVEWKKKRQ